MPRLPRTGSESTLAEPIIVADEVEGDDSTQSSHHVPTRVERVSLFRDARRRKGKSVEWTLNLFRWSRKIEELQPEEAHGSQKCWICWETLVTSATGPLIRACRGCKDPDLQWSHQTCIDKYVSNLPPPQPRPPVSEVPEESVPSEQGDSVGRRDPEPCTEGNSGDIATIITIGEGEAFSQTHHEAASSTRGTTSTVSRLHSFLAAHLPHIIPVRRNVGSLDTPVDPHVYKCTRCTDVYTVRRTKISPLKVLFTERDEVMLKWATLFMTACLFIVTGAVAWLFAAGIQSSITLAGLTLGRVAIICMVLCYGINAAVWALVIAHCSGHEQRRVLPVESATNPS
ncbi:hypothetical protein M427DRAFT_56270 [Gonapodya prolifera JEL478]|uniref:RING-CH-type domain-containing protein n=1 Tax=Gonapodya prolifera (strain JEL478) TaxID=1344416 RepID=A0A139AHD7_GONPJ|nr:hypothetical protein M427DRAFT_56270 [Gonapodya prolifera JEL478]|eukprot:KXS15974.1 hypothetical protein M427DRAFT_56270 [Gonapodya prolifera JEL478]